VINIYTDYDNFLCAFHAFLSCSRCWAYIRVLQGTYEAVADDVVSEQHGRSELGVHVVVVRDKVAV
jgi:hypothetical protein